MNFNPRFRKSGFGLVEAIIVAAAVALAIAGVYRFYTSVQAHERAHTEAQNAIQLTNNILRAYSSLGHFGGVNEARLVTENLIPPGMEVDSTGGTVTVGSVFGGTVSAAPVNLDGEANAGLVLTYSAVPKRICAKFVSSAAAGYNFRDINVNSVNVLGADRSLDEGLAVSACASQSESVVSFTISRNHSSALNSPGVCTVPASSPETQTIPCPSGYSGEITRTRSASCPPGATIPVWSDWSTVSNTCSLVCKPDPSSPQIRTSTPCPAGQYGTITERRVSTCAPGQTTGSPSWSDWVVVSNTCSDMCVAPADEIRSPGCPAGQSGEFIERRSASCPSPTGAPVWGPWTTLVYTCEKNCVLPSPNPERRWVPTSGNCDAGSTGTKYWEVEQIRTASCPSSTGAPVYTDWVNTGNIRNEDTSQCTALCTPEAELERWVPREEACPAGFTGSRSWEERQTRTSSCPPGATTPNTSQWVATGERRNFVDECEAQACRVFRGTTFTWRQPGNEYDCEGTVPSDVTIPSGQMLTVEGGAIVTSAVGGPANALNFRAAGRAQYVCNAGALAQTPTAPVCAPAACNVTGSQQVNWAQSGQPDIACTATFGSAIGGGGNFSVPVGGDFTVRDTTGPVFGTQQYQCVQATVSPFGAVARVVATNNSTCYGSCDGIPRPADQTRTYAGCPAGQYGTWVQYDSYESAAYPTCWANSIVNWSPSTPPPGACVACPAATTETQWVDTTPANCPSGQYGKILREKEQRRTRSYSCPAGTTSMPSPSYTNWVDTGEVRNKSGGNSCKDCPANSTEQELRWVAHTNGNCPAGQYGGIGREKEQRRTRTVTYSCPAGTQTLPSPSYGSWSSWTDTGNVRNTGTNTCQACPAAITETRWDPRNPGCPSGQVGQYTFEMQQTRSVTYSCPAGTQTLPSPNYTSWTDTGTTRNVVNTCQPECTVWDEYTTQNTIDTSCPPRLPVLCEPGQKYRHVVIRHLCPSGTQLISAGDWIRISMPSCVSANRSCM